jgi:hypothetical protein
MAEVAQAQNYGIPILGPVRYRIRNIMPIIEVITTTVINASMYVENRDRNLTILFCGIMSAIPIRLRPQVTVPIRLFHKLRYHVTP